jgi:hypothetical protein
MALVFGWRWPVALGLGEQQLFFVRHRHYKDTVPKARDLASVLQLCRGLIALCLASVGELH